MYVKMQCNLSKLFQYKNSQMYEYKYIKIYRYTYIMYNNRIHIEIKI